MRNVENFMKMSISMLSLFQVSKLENRIMLNTKHTMKYENFECSLNMIIYITSYWCLLFGCEEETEPKLVFITREH